MTVAKPMAATIFNTEQQSKVQLPWTLPSLKSTSFDLQGYLENFESLPPWFTGEPAPDSHTLFETAERQFVTATFAATSSVGSMDLPAVDLFCFDPGGHSSEPSHKDAPTAAKEDNAAALRRALVAASSSPFPS